MLWFSCYNTKTGLTRLAEKYICSCIQSTALQGWIFLSWFLWKILFLLQINYFLFFIKTKFHISEQCMTCKSPYPCKEQIGEWWYTSTWAESPKYFLVQSLGHPNSTELTITRWVFDEVCQALSPASTSRAKHPFTSCLNYFCLQGFTAMLCNLLRGSQAFFIIMKKPFFCFKFMQSHECIWYCITGKFCQANSKSSH